MIIIEPLTIADPMIASSNVPETDYTVWANNVAYTVGDRRIVNHQIVEAIKDTSTHAVTVPVATPATFGWPAHGLQDGAPVVFVSTGDMPSGITSGTTYYVKSPAANTFGIAATAGGTALDVADGGSGTITATAKSNYNKNPETEKDYWLQIGATNRWKMFDAQNNTQTSNADSITLTLQPNAIVTGLYFGNVDADSITVTMTDTQDGVVYSQTKEMVLLNAENSFWDWFFKKPVRKTTVTFLGLPVYATATIAITINRPGGTAKCGMCAIGQTTDIGLSERGVNTDIKDYSTTTFNADGTSKTVLRDYAKRMSIDVICSNERKDEIENQLASYRQTPIVWIGSEKYETTIIYGKYSGLKTVIESVPYSRMSLQIEGMV